MRLLQNGTNSISERRTWHCKWIFDDRTRQPGKMGYDCNSEISRHLIMLSYHVYPHPSPTIAMSYITAHSIIFLQQFQLKPLRSVRYSDYWYWLSLALRFSNKLPKWNGFLNANANVIYKYSNKVVPLCSINLYFHFSLSKSTNSNLISSTFWVRMQILWWFVQHNRMPIRNGWKLASLLFGFFGSMHSKSVSYLLTIKMHKTMATKNKLFSRNFQFA